MDRLMVSVSGVRGTVGGTLTPLVARDFGFAFARMLGPGLPGRRRRPRHGPYPCQGDKPGGAVVLGRDTRPSGPMFRDAVSAGLLAGGVNVVDLGVVTTPGVALMTGRLRASGGVIITASHNPAEYNGIKFLQPTGTGLTAAGAGRLKSLWQGGDFDLPDEGEQGAQSSDATTHDAHVEAVCGVCDVAGVAGRHFKVVLDSINGAGCTVTPMLLARLGCEVVHINAEPNGQFAHAPEPVEENLAGLCEAVREHGAAVGFAQDPDADRLVLADETGRFIGEEYTLALTVAFVLGRQKGKVAANMVTSRMIDDVAAAAGCEVVRAPTGEANVAEAMQREGCVFGGEGNGGVIDPRVVPVRDSLVGIAHVLGYLAETGRKLSELVGDIPRYVMLKEKLPCPPGAAEEVIQAAREEFAGRPGAAVNDADGLRVDLPEGWVSVRASNTEPIMRITAEAEAQEKADELMAQLRRLAQDVVGR